MRNFLLLILLFPVFSFGQSINTTENSGRRNIYNNAIKHFIIFSSKGHTLIFDTLLILKDDLLTDSLETTIEKTKIVLLDSLEISKRLQGDGSFIANRILPLSFDNGHFYINLIPFRVHKNKDEIIFENSGTCVVSYLYDSSKKSFKFYRSVFNGF